MSIISYVGEYFFFSSMDICTHQPINPYFYSMRISLFKLAPDQEVKGRDGGAGGRGGAKDHSGLRIVEAPAEREGENRSFVQP